ncbi:MAG: response regulator [Candidatus Eisenbacteria sp.]|nr:response regulator [Candidatus Eisenbacteria bacterium]
MIKRTKLLSTGSIGKLLGMDRTTVWGWIKSGKLPAERTIGGQYRVDQQALADLLREKGIPVPRELADDHPTRVLIADDDPAVLGFLEATLSRDGSGFEIATATNGFAAGKLVASFRPHLAVIDIQMPGLGGLDVCADIKKDKATKVIKIIVVTGYPTPENRERARRIGVEKFLEKPVGPEAFMDAVHSVLG